MKAASTRRLLGDPALAWSQRLKVEVGGTGTVAQAGVVLPRLMADRLGLTTGLADVVARAGFVPVRHRGRVLVDMACALAAGATCLSDVEAMTAQQEFYGSGGGASDSTMLRALDELGERIGATGLPGRRLARATAVARAKAWAGIMARHAQLPAVRVAGKDLTRPATEPGGRPRPVLVIRLDATLIKAASPKAQAAGHYKGGFGFHPLTGWCTNIGDALAVMQHPGHAGSFTAADHLAVLKASFAQIPAQWRADVPVSIDGAGASHDVIDYLTSLNTAPEHGNRGRRVEYTIGWPVDERTGAGIERPREGDGGVAVHTDGTVDPAAQVADLTGILRHGPGGDRLASWPRCMRLIVRRTPHPATKPAKLGEHPDWEYGAFVTNTPSGQPQFLDARHRTQAHAEDRMKQVQGLRRPQPALHRLRPQHRLAAAGRAGHLTDRLAAPPRPGRRPGQSLHQNPAVSDPVRPGAAGHPRQTTNPQDPTRLAMVHRSGHRLEPPASPAPPLTQPPPVPTTPQHPAGRGTGAHPSTLGHPAAPAPAFPSRDDPQSRRSWSSQSA